MGHVGAQLDVSAQVRVLRSLCRFQSYGSSYRSFHSLPCRSNSHKHTGPYTLDPRLEDLGKVIRDEYAVIRDHYGTCYDFPSYLCQKLAY
jgi:triacylglycerol lipase